MGHPRSPTPCSAKRFSSLGLSLASSRTSLVRFWRSISADWGPRTTLFRSTVLLPRQRLLCFDVALGVGQVFGPLRSFGAVGEAVGGEGGGAVDLSHVFVIKLLPFVARAVVVGEHVADRERVGGDAGVGDGLVVALGEILDIALRVLDDLEAGGVAGFANDVGEGGEIVAGDVDETDARSAIDIGAADLFEVEIGDGFRQRNEGVGAVVARADQAEFLAV